jgi:hypothetical protein
MAAGMNRLTSLILGVVVAPIALAILALQAGRVPFVP